MQIQQSVICSKLDENFDFRSLPTFCIHVSEQLCKNVESAVNVAYRPNDDACDGDVLSMMGRCSDLNSSQKYPPNYAIGVRLLSSCRICTLILHFCVIDMCHLDESIDSLGIRYGIVDTMTHK